MAPDCYTLAIRTAKALMEYPADHKDIIISFENGKDFYARRNKASISVYCMNKDY